MRIFVIDNENPAVTKLQQFITQELQLRGFLPNSRIEHFASAEDFLGKWQAGQKNQLIITDITLSGMNGLELAQKIRNVDEDVLIVFFTKTNDYAMQCYDLDIAYYLLKPATEQSVHLMMDRVLRRMAEQAC